VQRAVALAAANLGGSLQDAELKVSQPATGADLRQVLQSAKLAGPVYSQLVWLPMNEETMRLCWRVIARVPGSENTYMVLVDAENGDVLVRNNMTDNATTVSFRVFPSDSPSPFTPGHATVSIAQPVASETNRVVMVYSNGALDTNASRLDGSEPRR